MQRELRLDLARYLAARGKIEHISAASLSVNLPSSSATIDVSAGTAALGGKSPVSTRALFQIGSNTKAFTSVMLLQLEAQRKLHIDDTLGRWLPQYPQWKGVTLRRLLNMTSGIPGYDNQPAMMKAWAAAPGKIWSARELVSFAEARGGKGPRRATGWSYSNTNYLLAQMIVERVTGRTYAEELRRRFLNDSALRLTNTYYSPGAYPSSIVERLVSGYFYNNDPDNANLASFFGKDVRALNLSWAQGAGGIVATPQDVTRWSRALYEGGLLQPQQRRELMTIVSDATGKPIAATSPRDSRGFGLGVGQLTLPRLGTFWYYQGETLGYRMVYAWFPKSRVVFAVGVNSQPPGAQDKIGQLLTSVYQTLAAAGKL